MELSPKKIINYSKIEDLFYRPYIFDGLALEFIMKIIIL